MKPQRIQLQRTKGWRLPANTRKVDRSTKWGNPFKVKLYGIDLSLELFARTIRGIWTPAGIPPRKSSRAYNAHCEFLKRHRLHPMENVRAELAGLHLACWCKPHEKCHADILLTIANR